MSHALRHHRPPIKDVGGKSSSPGRRSHARRLLRTMVMLLAALCGAGGLAPVVPAQSPIQDVGGKLLADGIAAIVNSEIIMASELQTEMADATVRLNARYEGDEFTERLVQKQYEVLNRMIERKLQLQEAKAQNIAISDEEVDKAWEQLRRNPTALPASASQSKTVLREELMVRRLREMEARRGLVVSPEEIRAYYQEHQQQFTAPGEHHIRQILLLPKPDESMETLKTRAEVLLSQLSEGMSFEKLAEIFSDGPENVLEGDLGFVTKDELLAPLGAALDKLAPGEVSPLIETEIGIHILRLEESRQGATQPFENVKDMIGNRLYQKKLQQAQEAWLSSLKDKAYIEIRFSLPSRS